MAAVGSQGWFVKTARDPERETGLPQRRWGCSPPADTSVLSPKGLGRSITLNVEKLEEPTQGYCLRASRYPLANWVPTPESMVLHSATPGWGAPCRPVPVVPKQM